MTMNRARKWRVASSQDDVPPGICKCGRLTEREAWLPKIARFADAGAELLEPYESMGDQNEADAVLFFDEADSLLFKRASTGESCSTSISRNRNALMQKLDRFGGVVGWRAAVRASRGAGHAEKRRIALSEPTHGHEAVTAPLRYLPPPRWKSRDATPWICLKTREKW